MSENENNKSAPARQADAGARDACLEMLDRLRQEAFTLHTDRQLQVHPYVQAAQNGTLTIRQQQAFCGEQLYIQRSDALSFARLAGHDEATFPPPQSLIDCQIPKKDNDDLFQFLLQGEVYAAPLLVKYGKALGWKDEATIESFYREPSAKAQAYPSYWSRLALHRQRGIAAAACAVNFPAWGKMCHKIYNALLSHYCFPATDLEFLKFFATPIENLDDMAARIMAEEQVVYEDLRAPVRLLQEYEVLFWDAVFDQEAMNDG